MPWIGPAIGAVGSIVAADMSGGDKNGGAGSSTASQDPWAAAQPWMRQNIATGQNLQQQYQNTPFNQSQLDAYGNMGAQSDYMRQLVPSLLGTASRQQGFNRGDAKASPEAYKFDAQGPQGGLLGSLTGRALGNYGAANPPPPQQQQQRQQGTFTQQNEDPYNNWRMGNFRGSTGLGSQQSVFGQPRSDGGPAAFNGGYGEFRYGMDMPVPGTQAFRDMNEYFQYGGTDPYDIYGRDPKKAFGGWGGLESGMMGVSDGNSSGSATGAAASDGSGGGTAF